MYLAIVSVGSCLKFILLERSVITHRGCMSNVVHINNVKGEGAEFIAELGV